MMPSLDALLAAVERLPAVYVELDEARRSAELHVEGRAVARLDLRHCEVFVSAPFHTIPMLRSLFPSSRATCDGIAFHVADADVVPEALAAIRRRASVERFGWQFRVASP